MAERPQEQGISRQSWHQLRRSFFAALLVGSLGGGLIMLIEALIVAFTRSEPSLIASAPFLIGYGLFFGAIVWIPAWAVTAGFALAWLWTVGQIETKRARYVLAFIASIVLYTLTDAVAQPSDWATPLPLLAAVLAAIGVWVTVPWIMKPRN